MQMTSGSAPLSGDLTLSDMTRVLGFTLSDQQWSAVSAELVPAVMVAGAGSGKTTSMSARICYLIGSGLVEPGRVLGLTFTTKATSQLLDSVRRSIADLEREFPDRVPHERADPVIATYNSFAAGIVREFGALLGRDFTGSVLTDGARQQLLYRMVCNTSRDMSAVSVNPASITNRVLALDGELSELAVEPAEVIAYDKSLITYFAGFSKMNASSRAMLATAQQRIKLAELVQDWRDLKAARDLVEFSDQVRIAREIVTAFPHVASDIRSRFSIALLDEYQDTSISQRILLQKIFPDGFPVTAVGDPCQAIYGWRGASVDNINNFPEHFPDSNGQPALTFPLAENRRSGVRILESANAISAELRLEHPAVERLSAVRPLQGDITLAMCESSHAELEWLTEAIAHRHANLADGEDIAVLSATTDYLIRMRDSLTARGIPVQLHAAAGLLTQPLVMDLHAYLAIVHEPTANSDFLRIASGVQWRIGARDLAALGSRAAELARVQRGGAAANVEQALDAAVAGIDVVDVVSLSDALLDLGPKSQYSPEAWSRFEQLADLITKLRSLAGLPLVEFISRVMHLTGIDIQSQLREGDRIAINSFVNLAAEFDDIDGRVSLGAFLSRLRDIDRFGIDVDFDEPVVAGAVQLITIYKSKGLEYTHVFVPNLTDSGFPGGKKRTNWTTDPSIVPWPQRLDAPDHMKSFPDFSETDWPERRLKEDYQGLLRERAERDVDRLGYVALTRAKDSLTVTGAWWGFTQKRKRNPHRFLSTMHELLAGTDITIAEWAPEPEPDTERPEFTWEDTTYSWPNPVPSEVAVHLREQAEWVQRANPAESELVSAESERVRHWRLTLAALRAERDTLNAEVRRALLPRNVGASTLLRALKEPEKLAVDLARPMPQRPAVSAARGTDVHAFIESYYDQGALFDRDDLDGADFARDPQGDERTHALQQAFLLTRFADMVPLAIEQHFAIRYASHAVTGYIDAVFDEGGRALIVDWKTGSRDHLDERQLAIYRIAFALITGQSIDTIDTSFVLLAAVNPENPRREDYEIPVDTNALVDQLMQEVTLLGQEHRSDG